MRENRNLENISRQTIDMLIDNTLRRQGVQLKKTRNLTLKEKQQLRKLINELKQSVQALTQTKKS